MGESKRLRMRNSLEVNSPCVKQCDFNRGLEICNSCKRTIQEIRDWSKMSESQQQAVLKRIRDLG
ncbi:MAG: DUF1289 domain-containing protein [Porticoccaceae bacterium]|nr:DUF1289 domain-containing protein [Porticoccaceae bacterium]